LEAADLYVERFFPVARHIEVQLLGDGETVPPWRRECSLQRQRQKLIESPPRSAFPYAVARAARRPRRRPRPRRGLRSLCTVEFLLSGDQLAFIEANPRLRSSTQ
jgi:acetyl/propionyl-CoA carboxylase alpha subunit